MIEGGRIPSMELAKPLPEGFTWCAECQAMREGWHIHFDELEHLSKGDLLAIVRDYRAMPEFAPVPP